MPRLFVSHATADKPLVDTFVDTVVKLGCGVSAESIFYSSGGDTGVPSGVDLNTYVRDEVSEADLVLAIITPVFQTRPFCVAELGAAWSRAGQLFPVALPGMARGELDGVMSGMTIRYLNDPVALDELHDRIVELSATKTATRTWGLYRDRWLT